MKYIELPKEYDDFIGLLSPGVKFKIVENAVHLVVNKSRLYHVLGVFDDVAVVVKYFGLHKQWWHYEALDGYLLWVKYQGDRILFVK